MNTVLVTQPQDAQPQTGDLYTRNENVYMLLSFYPTPDDANRGNKHWMMVGLVGCYYEHPTPDLEVCRKGFTFLQRNAIITVS